jgi:hypothetical protein
MARDGRLPAVKVGTGWRFHPDRLAVEPRALSQKPRAGTLLHLTSGLEVGLSELVSVYERQATEAAR